MGETLFTGRGNGLRFRMIHEFNLALLAKPLWCSVQFLDSFGGSYFTSEILKNEHALANKLSGLSILCLDYYLNGNETTTNGD